MGAQMVGHARAGMGRQGSVGAGSDAFSPDAVIAVGAGALAPEAEKLIYVVRGRSFLRYMVRKIVGTLLDVGRGKLRVADIPRLFELRDRSRSGPTVPPQGLYLVSVEYPDPTASLETRR
jgi:tRNA U38,U39,U40 pseudouridine synthase TruA